MSFSTEIKKILCKCEYMCPGCRRAELAGFFMFSGRLTDEQIRCRTAVSEVSLRAVNGIKEEFGIDVKNVNASQLQMIRSQLLCDVFLYDCCKIAYIRGAFLGSGSVNDPEKEYHLEFDAKNENEAEKLTDVLNEYKETSKESKELLNGFKGMDEQIAQIFEHINENTKVYSEVIGNSLTNYLNGFTEATKGVSAKFADATDALREEVEKLNKSEKLKEKK